MLRRILKSASVFFVSFAAIVVSTGLVYADPESKSYVISGFVKPDISSTSEDINSGFTVSIDGTTDSHGITDKNGHFEFSFKPSSTQKYKVLISKDGYLTREVTDVKINSDITIGSIDKPLEIWPGDLNQDSTINMSDVMNIAKTFNFTTSDENFVQSYDFNIDSTINMTEVLVIAKHFNAIPSNYPKVNVISKTSEYLQVVASGDKTIGLKSDGSVWDFDVTPKHVEGLNNINSVFCVSLHGILAVTKDDGHILKSFGDGYKDFTKLKHVKKISGGYQHTLYLTEEGSVYANGYNYGYLGIEKSSISSSTIDVPIEVDLGGKKAIDIAAGNGYSLVVIDDGTVYGFGKNENGQLGLPVGADASEPIYLPVMIPSLTNVKAVAVAPSVYNRSYALKDDGSIWSWGYFSSSLGIGESKDKIILPTKVIDTSEIMTEAITVSVYSLQALKEDGSLWSCGLNYSGEFGIGNSYNFSNYSLIKIPTISNIKSISAGENHIVAQKNDGSVWCWGENRSGQLGLGDKVTRYSPESTSAERDCYFDTLNINYGDSIWISNASLYNSESTKLTLSVPYGKAISKIQSFEDDIFAGLTFKVTQAESLPGKASIEVSENGTVVKDYTINFLEPSDLYYSSTDGSIDFGGDCNMYFIRLEKDKTYKIYSTGNTDTFLELRDSKFKVCDSNNDDGDGSNFSLLFTPKYSNVYALFVKHFDELSGTGKYDLFVEEVKLDSEVSATNN